MTSHKVNVRWSPVYTPCATHKVIKGYNVYAWIGHVLWGEVHGTRSYHETKAKALKQVKHLRQLFKCGG